MFENLNAFSALFDPVMNLNQILNFKEIQCYLMADRYHSKLSQN